ncbi:centromere-associated protein E [Eucyclogobius newberryi]|uniref:centromere-associated protein E n=1 Tax=Eucyclogobius newberryi TaxID=166745 RepID=UPI003B5ACC0A
MAEDSAVKVCVRVRPLIDREDAACENAPTLHWKADHNCVHQVDDGATVKSFSFDRVFTVHETTKQLYQAIAKPLVVSTVQGYNGTIFAYGQTSSGKTFTMMGSDQTPGVIPLAVEDVFQTIQNCPDEKEFLLRVSYMEIYNETVTDLLVESWRRKPLEVRESLNKNIYVADLSEELVTSTAQALHWIRVGEKNRHYGKTKMNQRSSRSHTIFRMILESRETSDSETSDGAIIVSHLNLVDLAGSERASQTGAEGARFKEGCNINRSLFTLGQVIKKLTEESQTGFINYRDSKLTRILQNSLGGNAKTVIICTITPETLDETMSSLQFASTAKKMKNDPHVTEVSDDGALLKRYRNEIVDLKRRLLEVSSVTQTTATEKELLSQTLQEKDQLQREQEDRIRNLTNLLVSTNSIIPAARPAPKRRVTWGGQMLKLVSGSSAASELNLTEVSSKKRKTTVSDRDLGESFHHWEIPEEAPEDMDDSHVTTRSFGDSPKDVPPERLSSLEQQLESERLQSSEAQATVKALNERLAELELQLQEELQLKEDARRREAELELQAQMEKERLKEPAENVDQIKRQFSEAVQLCEALASEKDSLLSERNYLKDELGLSLEQIRTLEKENADLSHGLEEKREIDEFENLEQQIIHDNEEELREEISRLKIALQSSERKCQDVQNDFDALSVELKKKCDLIERLQQMNGKDLVEEVSTLQRSLGDAEKVSLDTKKEWACLRSQTMALEERTVMLTLHSEKSENEATSLRCQLEREKSKYKKMQFDLQKELNVTFEENVKLGALLDGKVPKNLIDNVELERSLTKLNKDLASCHEANAELQLKLEQELQAKEQHLQELQAKEQHLQELQAKEQHLQELQAKEQHLQELQAKEQHLQELQVKVAELVKQLEESECLRVSLTEQLHEIHQLKADLEEKITDGETARRTDEDIQKELEEQLEQLTAELQSVQAQKEAAMSECERLRSVCSDRDVLHQLKEERDQLKEERDQLKEERDQLKEERDMIDIQDELRALQEKNVEQKENIQKLKASSTQEEASAEQERLQAQMTSLEEQLQRAGADGKRSKEELDELVSRVSALTEDKEQLQQLLDNTSGLASLQSELNQAETQENMAKLQQELDEAQRKVQSLEQMLQEKNQKNLDLERLSQERLDELERRTAELQRAGADGGTSKEELDELVSRVSALTENKEQLQQLLDTLKEEKQQLGGQMTDLTETVQSLTETVQSLTEQKNRLKQLHHDMEEELEMLKKESEAQQVLQQSLNEAKQTICDLREEMSLLPDEQLLKESTLQLQEEFKELKAFWEECRDWDSERGNYRLLSAPPGLDSLPKNTVQSVNAVNDLCWQTIGRISLMFVQQHKFFQSFHQLWEDLVKKDVSVFEERRLQDVLTCRATASSFNIKHLDFVPLWKLRMKELLEKRRCYIQKMEQTRTRMRASFKREFSTELKEKKSYENRLQEICASEPLDVSALDSFLDAQQLLRNTLLQERNRFFEALSEEHTELLKELTQAAAQAQTLLEEEKNKRFILERAVDDSTLKTEATIIMDNRMLQDQLTAAQYQLRVALDQRRAAQDQLTAAQDQLTAAQDQLTAAQDQLTAAQEELEVVSLEKQQLQKVQVQAERRVSAHKEATQLLQTELQDALAKLHEMERREASEAKRNASAELQQLKRTVSELELELQTSSEKHQHELQRLTSLLDVKTTSLRRLKETLRSEQDDPPYLEGEALAARLVQPKGVIQTRTLLDKSKRDEEIKRLKLRITELESLVSSLHADVAKWKQRALKMKSAEVRPLCTPPKRQRLDSPRLRSPMKPLDSPRLRSPMKPLDSPRLRSPMKPLNSPSLLNLPKSGFFGGGSSSEVLERNCPKQFFDNSGLGAARGEGEEADWPQWPLSPNQQKMCNKQ